MTEHALTRGTVRWAWVACFAVLTLIGVVLRADLGRFGYAQELFRNMGGFSNFAISFSIISILTGAILLFSYGLQFAGPIINTFGGRDSGRFGQSGPAAWRPYLAILGRPRAM